MHRPFVHLESNIRCSSISRRPGSVVYRNRFVALQATVRHKSSVSSLKRTHDQLNATRTSDQLTCYPDNRYLNRDEARKQIRHSRDRRSTSIANPMLIDANSIVAGEAIGWTMLTIGITWRTSCFVGRVIALREAITTTGIAHTMARGAFESAIRARPRNYSNILGRAIRCVESDRLTAISTLVRCVPIPAIIIMITNPETVNEKIGS
jgi:hypothetical protein